MQLGNHELMAGGRWSVQSNLYRLDGGYSCHWSKLFISVQKIVVRCYRSGINMRKLSVFLDIGILVKDRGHAWWDGKKIH